MQVTVELVWGKVVPELTGANVSFAVRARVTLLRDLGSALSPDNAFGIIQGLETVALKNETTLLKMHQKLLTI